MTYNKKVCKCDTHNTIFNIEEVEKKSINSSGNIVLFFYDDLEKAREYIFNRIFDENDRCINITDTVPSFRNLDSRYRSNLVEIDYSPAIQSMYAYVIRMRPDCIVIENPKSHFLKLDLDFINAGHKLFITVPKENNSDKNISELVYSLFDSIPEDSYQRQLLFHHLTNYAPDNIKANPYQSSKLGVEIFDQTEKSVRSYFLTAPHAHLEMN